MTGLPKRQMQARKPSNAVITNEEWERLKAMELRMQETQDDTEVREELERLTREHIGGPKELSAYRNKPCILCGRPAEHVSSLSKYALCQNCLLKLRTKTIATEYYPIECRLCGETEGLNKDGLCESCAKKRKERIKTIAQKLPQKNKNETKPMWFMTKVEY